MARASKKSAKTALAKHSAPEHSPKSDRTDSLGDVWAEQTRAADVARDFLSDTGIPLEVLVDKHGRVLRREDWEAACREWCDANPDPNQLYHPWPVDRNDDSVVANLKIDLSCDYLRLGQNSAAAKIAASAGVGEFDFDEAAKWLVRTFVDKGWTLEQIRSASLNDLAALDSNGDETLRKSVPTDLPQSPVASEAQTPNALNRTTSRTKRSKNTNGKMLDKLMKDRDVVGGWTAAKWAMYLKCARSTVVGCAAWEQLRDLREEIRAKQALDRHRKPKKSDTRRDGY